MSTIKLRTNALAVLVCVLIVVPVLLLWPTGANAQWTTNGTNINNTNSGNVGVGTPTPSSRLTVIGPVQNGVYTVQIDSTAGGLAGSQNGILLIGTTATTYLTAGATTINGSAPHININGADNTNFTATLGNTGGFGRVLRLRSSGTGTIPIMQLEGNNGGTVTLSALANGNVGIGTANPDALAKLHLFGSGPFGQDLQTTGTEWTRLRFIAPSRTWGFFLDGGTAGLGSGKFGLHDYTASAWRMVFDTAGNVGIGTTAPANKLHVAGNITVDGNVNAKYQDLAEWVDSSQELSPGTVVVLDSAQSNQVIASTHSYDSRVAGVISRQPGVVLGEAGEGRVLVATTGRVKIKVDATNGPINIGDLLVTSDKEGVAMKSVPVKVGGGMRMHRPGTLIGKALEPLAAGNGEILVLLSLQ
jgi:hypothetical protein